MKAASIIAVASLTALATPASAESWQFGDWSVSTTSDEMDVYHRAVASTILTCEEGERYCSRSSLGLDYFADLPIDFYNAPQTRLSWPFCYGDAATFSVDGSASRHFLNRDRGHGECDATNRSGSSIAAFKRGKTARMRFGRGDSVYTLSLEGFTAAHRCADAISRKRSGAKQLCERLSFEPKDPEGRITNWRSLEQSYVQLSVANQPEKLDADLGRARLAVDAFAGMKVQVGKIDGVQTTYRLLIGPYTNEQAGDVAAALRMRDIEAVRFTPTGKQPTMVCTYTADLGECQ